MRQLEVFFDYACPYCLQGHEYLTELLPQFPDIEVVWRPCEAHPRPEQHGPHSDLCIQGLFHVLEQGADVWEYHRRAYNAALKERVDIEDPKIVAGYMFKLIDTADLLRVLKYDIYAKQVKETNDYAYSQSGVWAVPSYRMDGKKLDAVENVGVTKDQLEAFLKKQ